MMMNYCCKKDSVTLINIKEPLLPPWKPFYLVASKNLFSVLLFPFIYELIYMTTESLVLGSMCALATVLYFELSPSLC